MAEECSFEVNERTSLTLTVSFLDEDAVPVTPTSATVRIDDEKTGIEIRGTGNLSPLSTSVDIEISSGENRILKDRRDWEIRIVTVEFDYNAVAGVKHGTAQYRYKVLNLFGVHLASSPSLSPSESASPSA